MIECNFVFCLQHWRSLGGSERDPLRTLQAYGWPALRRGMELVAITDPFIMEGRDGVSLTYVMAAATLMFDVDSYVSLPKGGGVSQLIHKTGTLLRFSLVTTDLSHFK